jgi:phenylacetic acid degradation protein paaN
MSNSFFLNHQQLLNDAVQAIEKRTYWSAFPEIPSGKIYGETANETGKAAFESRRHQPYPLTLPATVGQTGSERSPYGFPLEITYPKLDLDPLLKAILAAQKPWRAADPETWAGVCLEILQRLNRRSFEMAYAVMHTTGQGFMMAFQAGGPHAQDRGLEAVAYAWTEINHVPKAVYWEKPQGKNEPLKLNKQFKVVPRGIGLVIGCSTFPTWNAYPGLFANLATGNAVIVKPHPSAILPLALTVEIARQVLTEAGFDPNVVTLVAHDPDEDTPQKLALRPEIKIIDFTGSTKNGEWLEKEARQAAVYTEKAGVNQVVIDSTNDFSGMVKNLAFSISLYSGQMCTAPQNLYIPKNGVETLDGHFSFDQVVQGLVDSLAKLLGDPARAVEILGAIQSQATLDRLEAARALGKLLRDTEKIKHPQFPEASVHTPLLVQLAASDHDHYLQECFGPIVFVIPVDTTEQALELAETTSLRRGSLTFSVYSTKESVLNAARETAAEAGVNLSCNLTGGVYVNQSAAFSDYHGTGANPAANASLTDSAFVANRFRIIETRIPV